MRLPARLPTLLLSAALAACAADAVLEDGPDDDAISDGKADGALTEGSALARAVLKVANEATKATLTEDVGLTSRTAGNIVTARAAAPFATLAELDRVPYVGPVAFDRLVAYVQAEGLVGAGGNPLSARTAQPSWSGYYWSMARGELALGWDDRKVWTEAEARAFDACIGSYTSSCVALLADMAGPDGAELSPLMKFDYMVRQQLEATYGPGGAPATAYAHATKWELEQHYIGDNREHRYWNSRGYAGKCIGWALSNFDYAEPTRAVTLDGVEFAPADIKGLLASIYNGAQFFIPEELAIGNEFHDYEGADSQAYYDDVAPDDFVRALFATIGQGKLLEGDLEPGDGVWNYPIHAYDLTIERRSAKQATVSARIEYADDEVEIDLVASADPARPDLKSRTLRFELDLPSGWDDLAQATGGRWLGDSVDTHPDVLILGIQPGWRQEIYDYRNTDMNTEVNFALLKRAQVHGSAWTPIVDDLLERYYAR
ncbi:MAG: helix-hairpin-helix domain-containing protein [Kofleriaceae bacterium]